MAGLRAWAQREASIANGDVHEAAPTVSDRWALGRLTKGGHETQQRYAGPTGDLWKFPAGGNPRDHLAYTNGGPFVANAAYVYFADGVRIRRVAR